MKKRVTNKNSHALEDRQRVTDTERQSMCLRERKNTMSAQQCIFPIESGPIQSYKTPSQNTISLVLSVLPSSYKRAAAPKRARRPPAALNVVLSAPDLSPEKDVTDGEAVALVAPVPVGVVLASLVCEGVECDCVAATLATEAMELEAAARRGSAALQYEVTVFSTGGLSCESGQLL